jgi:hypothetical protein
MNNILKFDMFVTEKCLPCEKKKEKKKEEEKKECCKECGEDKDCTCEK